jgi:sec-independent protein translocase protein TatB
MFNIGISEFFIIALVALVLLGPDQLPQAVKSVARVIRDFRRFSSHVSSQIDPNIQEAAQELREALDGEPRPRRPVTTRLGPEEITPKNTETPQPTRDDNAAE